MHLTATGTGKCGNGGSMQATTIVYATPAPTPKPTGPPHVLTADYWPSATLVADCATKIAPYVTYEYPNTATRPQLKACGVKQVAYASPAMPQKGLVENGLLAPGGAYAAAAAKDCAGNVVTTNNGTGYLADPHAATTPAFFQKVLDDYYATWTTGQYPGTFDAIFLDNMDSDYGASAQPCSWKGFLDWTSATTGVLSKLDTHGAKMFVNALTLPEAYMIQPTGDTVANVLALLAPATVAGGEQEGFVYDLAGHWDRWAWEIDTEIGAVAAHRTYWAYANHGLANVDPASAAGIQWRTFLYASWLLGYDPALSIYQTWFNTPSGMRVMPETGIVPLQPLRTAASSVAELEVGTGPLYVRQFGQCFYRGAYVGPCAAVVNASATASAPVSMPQYGHSVALVGGGIDDGGTLGFQGPKVTSLGPLSGAILAP